jgi:hypothetical protein
MPIVLVASSTWSCCENAKFVQVTMRNIKAIIRDNTIRSNFVSVLLNKTK